jgi:hypothetical protein
VTEPWPRVDFLCNICGDYNREVALPRVENRECPSCARCGSSLRMRSLMYLLSMELFGRPLTLPEFPPEKSMTGLGLSDWEGYSHRLEELFDYTNTFYHREPRLDVTRQDPARDGRYTFIIASDVYEHIPLEGLAAAFKNAYRMLRHDGFMLFTVPFAKRGETAEHFPRLHDFRIEETEGGRVLRNRTADGQEEVFRDLVFHGGDGSTLEMRHFSEPALRRAFADAGFHSSRPRFEPYPIFGVLWPMDWAVPMIVRKSMLSRAGVRRASGRFRALASRVRRSASSGSEVVRCCACADKGCSDISNSTTNGS